MRTNDVASYASVAQLFDLDAWIRSVFYARLVFHYSSRLNPMAVQLWSAIGGRSALRPLPEEPPQGFSVGSAGVSVERMNCQPFAFELLGQGLSSVVVGDSVVYNFVMSTDSDFESPQPVPLFSYTDQVFESLVANLAFDNCLSLSFNSVEYVVRLLKPTARNNVTVCAYHIKSVLPRVAIFVNGLLHVDEFLSDTQRMQGIGGGSLQVFSNNVVGFTLSEVVAAELPSCESASDYAFFKTLAEAARLADFYDTSGTTGERFAVDSAAATMHVSPTTRFTCNPPGFFHDPDRKIVTLKNNTVWTSSMRLAENYFCFSLDIRPRTAGPISSSTQLVWTDNGAFSIVILPMGGQLSLVVFYDNLAVSAPRPLESGVEVRLTLEIVKKSRPPNNSLDSARFSVLLNRTLIANLNRDDVSTTFSNTNLKFGNSSAQVEFDVSAVELELVRSRQL